MSAFRVLISGAGLGGLCLAQALRRAGIAVHVFERDATPGQRSQGYRLHIGPDGLGALFAALPPELYSLFDATAMKPEPFTTLLDTNLLQRRRGREEEREEERDAEPTLPLPGACAHVNVNRATLRQILLAGLEDVVHFGAPLTCYESDDSGVTAHFADGSSARGELLVGADGLHSPVRRQRVPAARLQDSGVRAIYARVPLAEAMKVVPAGARADVFSVAVDAEKRFLGVGPVVFPTPPPVAAAALAPWVRLEPQADYVVCIIGGRREFFDALNPQARQARGEELQRLALQLLGGWSDEARAIPARGDPSSFFLIEMFTSIPCELPPPRNVTLLGDAIHAMTPTLGRGANVALRDAALLARCLLPVARGEQALASALATYEAEMTRYGFDVVRSSAAMGTRLMGQEPLPT